MANSNREFIQRRPARVRYRFVQHWPKEGAITSQAVTSINPNEQQKVESIASEKKSKKQCDSLRDDCRRFSRENSFCSTDSLSLRNASSRTNTPLNQRRKLLNIRRRSQCNTSEASNQLYSESATYNQRFEIYHLPPMLLPAIHKSKAFDFKAMKSSRPRSPPIDPFFYSPRCRRRRAANQGESRSPHSSRNKLFLMK